MRLSKGNLLSEDVLAALLERRPLACDAPWPANDDEAVERFLRGLADRILERLDLRERSEWNHYGSGYASFIELWLYRPTPEFRALPSFGTEHEYNGLSVLLSRQIPFFAFCEGRKDWGARTGSSLLPGRIDHFDHPAPRALVEPVEAMLVAADLTRLTAEDLDQPLPPHIDIETNLGERPFRLFDAVFNWMD